MSDPHLPGDPPIPLILRRSAQARRISLRISQLDGRVTLTMPKRLAEREALDFARSKEGWIRQHLEARGDDVVVGDGVEIPLGGKMYCVQASKSKRVCFCLPARSTSCRPKESRRRRQPPHHRPAPPDAGESSLPCCAQNPTPRARPTVLAWLTSPAHPTG